MTGRRTPGRRRPPGRPATPFRNLLEARRPERGGRLASALMRRSRGGYVGLGVAAALVLVVLGLCGAPSRSAPRPRGRRRRAAVGVVSRRAPAPAATPLTPPPGATVLAVDGDRLGGSFQGVGAISGGGGNSRLLIDYPAAERSAILDELFLPGDGASLQLLKLEIGGGGNSTDGSEPSVEPAPGHVDCSVGYELWLARQALARDPGLQVGGLQWSAPGWVGARNGTLWTRRDIRYLLTWLGCARRAGVPISFLGGWNEHYVPGDPRIAQWYVALRRALDVHGYADVRIVAADANGGAPWAVVDQMIADPAFGRSVAIIGAHDVCGIRSGGYRCAVTATARRFARAHHELLWQSELGRVPDQPGNPSGEGPGALARALDNAYLQGSISATLLWPLLDATPPYQPFPNRGLVLAGEPWSGYYWISPLTWVVAQTTQFTRPGWRFVPGAAGNLPGGGTYVTYAAPDRSAWSTVIETSTRRSPARLWLHVSGGLPGDARAWVTELQGPERVADLGRVPAGGGWLSVEVAPRTVTTVTTVMPPRRVGPAVVPPPRPMPLPYRARPDAAGMAAMLAPLQGSFQYQQGGWITQTTIGPPVEWLPPDIRLPYAVVGSPAWVDYTVATEVRLPPGGPGRPTGALLIAGFRGAQPHRLRAYTFSVDAAGTWRLAAGLATVLSTGHVVAARRYRLALTARGGALSAAIDGRRVTSVRVSAPVSGLAGIGSLGYYPVSFDGLAVTPVGR